MIVIFISNNLSDYSVVKQDGLSNGFLDVVKQIIH